MAQSRPFLNLGNFEICGGLTFVVFFNFAAFFIMWQNLRHFDIHGKSAAFRYLWRFYVLGKICGVEIHKNKE